LLPVLESNNISAGKEDFLISFFGDITLLFMGGFVLAALLNKYGISRMIARNIIKRTSTSPSRVLFSIILVSSLLSMWMSNTATAAMMFAILAPIVMSLPEGSNFSKALALAIPFACNLGGIGTPIGTPPNAIAMEYLQQMGFNISFALWMVIAVPLMIVLLILLWRLILKIYPPAVDHVELEIESIHEFRNEHYIVTGIFLITVIGWLTSGYTGISPGTVGLSVVLMAFGSQLLLTNDFRNISWDILFMLGGGLCLGAGIKLSGLANSIASLIPAASSLWFVLILLILIAAVMTSFMSNTATANLLIPVAISLPHGEIILVIAISLMCSSSMVLPISTPPNAIAFGSGLINSGEMMKSGTMITIISLIGILLCCMFYVPLFF
ncbi:MAG: DASS family sodium-coupled anion symporter, partial [Saprospiraceae bacterium]|nr:DASS family sodium-coupled anion symporter [Saprospiraceae bacterium]